MPRSFEDMFRDYDKELADVESERIAQNRKTEEKYDGERNGLLQEMQAKPDDAELRMNNQLKIENAYGNEDREIKHNNEVAQGKRDAIEADRHANQQERIEASGLKYDSGPIPEPPPAPPPPPEPKQSEAREAQTEPVSGQGILRSLRDNAAAQWTNVTAAVTGIAMNIAETSHTPEIGHSQHQRPPIEGPAVAGMPSQQHAAVHPPHLEPIETIETDQQRTQATTARVEPPEQPRVQTTVYGVDEIVRPPPPPPPPANDNQEKSAGKSR